MSFKKIISELQSFGVTQPQIAAVCGCAQATISDLSTGKSIEPRFSLGQAIHELHKNYSKKIGMGIKSSESKKTRTV